MKIVALSLFILTYALLLIFPKIRAYIALASGGLFVILGILPVNKLLGSIDWNVILMIAGIWESFIYLLSPKCQLC